MTAENSEDVGRNGSLKLIRKTRFSSSPIYLGSGPRYIRKIRSIRKIARTERDKIETAPFPRWRRITRSLIAFVIPIINNASIVTARRWVAGELNALTTIIGLRWMVNRKYTGTGVIECKRGYDPSSGWTTSFPRRRQRSPPLLAAVAGT